MLACIPVTIQVHGWVNMSGAHHICRCVNGVQNVTCGLMMLLPPGL